MSFWNMVGAVLVVILVILFFAVMVLGLLGVFEHHTDDGTVITRWQEVTPPHAGLRCWKATELGSVWCEEQ